MSKAIETNIGRTQIFREFSNAVSNSAIILIVDASTRYRALAGLSR